MEASHCPSGDLHLKSTIDDKIKQITTSEHMFSEAILGEVAICYPEPNSLRVR